MLGYVLGGLALGTGIMSSRAYAKQGEAEALSLSAKADAKEFLVEQSRVQAKADALTKLNNYNDLAARQMVMGVAQGRVVSEGSAKAIIDADAERYRFEKMWDASNEVIERAAIYNDIAELRQAGVFALEQGKSQAQIGTLQSLFQAGMMFGSFGGSSSSGSSGLGGSTGSAEATATSDSQHASMSGS